MITEQFVKEMMEAFRQQQTIHKRFALHIVLQVRGKWRRSHKPVAMCCQYIHKSHACAVLWACCP